MDSKNTYGWEQNAENGFGFDVFERYYKGGDEFPTYFARVTGD
jgi:hypothetical protein